MSEYGVDSMTGRLRRVAMRAPGAMLSADPDVWHYAKPIDPGALQAQYKTFVGLVEASGAEIMWLPDADDGLADSVFTYDPSFVVPAGAVIFRPGKALRQPEAELHRHFYDGVMPVLGTIEAPGLIEGGDCIWLDQSTIAIGRSFRTNQSGIDQFATLIAPTGIEVKGFDMSYLHGPDACLHLMTTVSPLDVDLALVHAPLMPIALYQEMEAMGYHLLHAPADEFEASRSLSLNVLATGPRKCIAIDGFPATVELMRSAGCEVAVFDADELCIPCEGGPTCLTRPILRQ